MNEIVCVKTKYYCKYVLCLKVDSFRKMLNYTD